MENIWQAILNLQASIRTFEETVDFCWVNLKSSQVLINKPPNNSTDQIVLFLNGKATNLPATTPSFSITSMGNVELTCAGPLDPKKITFLEKYLPYCFISLKAKRLKRAISVAHFAQTLDAKIATPTGDSKWIGNNENLIHAHRMRALCDGVLVGRKTVEHDAPRLNVRHVKGENPIRIILGNPKSDFESLLLSGEEKIIVFGPKGLSFPTPIILIPMPYNENNLIAPESILQQLYQLGIYHVYVEGGASTTSLFLNENAIDILQLHLAPLIFGSGKSSIVLPAINQVKEGISFKEHHFSTVGDSIMFTGFLN